MGDFTRGAPPHLTKVGADKLRDVLREHEAHLAGKPGAQPALLAYTDLSDADLTGANLTLADLTGARLHRARLDGARLSMSKCGGSDFRNATLDGADLRWADLRGACLRATGLNDANMAESNGAEALAPVYDSEGRMTDGGATKRAIDLGRLRPARRSFGRAAAQGFRAACRFCRCRSG